MGCHDVHRCGARTLGRSTCSVKALCTGLTERDVAQVARAFEHRALLGLRADRIILHPVLHEHAAARVGLQPEGVAAAARGLARTMSDPDWVGRKRAIEALGRIGGGPAFDVALLAAASNDAATQARRAIEHALVQKPRA